MHSQVKQTQDPLDSPHPVALDASLPGRLELTRSQQTVLDLLTEVPQAIAAQDLCMLLRQTRSIGLATVYRALEALKSKGVVKCVVGPQGKGLYSLVGQDAHYVKCLQCHRSIQLERCPLRDLTQNFQAAQNPQGTRPFKVYYHTLEFFGLCPACQ